MSRPNRQPESRRATLHEPPRRSRILRARIILVFLITVILLGSVGCQTTIVPPSDLHDPTSVFVIDYGRHCSLILPREEQSMLIEYAYGDWNWFALDKSTGLAVLPTLFWPSRGALGRWPWNLEPDLEVLRWHIVCEQVLEITVESDRVTELLAQLDARYETHIDTMLYQPVYRLKFVHDDASYCVLHNCNHALADWLRRLDCKVYGFAMFADFRVRRPG